MTDTINEFFGKRGVRFISWLAVVLIGYGFLFAFAAISLAPASWWVTSMDDHGVPDYQAAFAAVFGQGMWTIAGSLVAFLLGQLIDVAVFHRIRQATGERHVWLRATGSTAISQVVDSFVVIWIAFVLEPATLADLAVPCGRQRQLRVQDGLCGRPDSVAVPDAACHHPLSGRRSRGGTARRRCG